MLCWKNSEDLGNSLNFFCTPTMVLFEIKVNFWNFILKIGKISELIIQLIESSQAMNFDYMLLIVGEQIHLLVCY